MKKTIAIALLAVSTSVFANGGHHHDGNGKWLAPFIIGGVIGYATAPRYIPPQPVYVPVPQPVYVPVPVPVPQPTPYYIQVEEFDPNCNCFVRFFRRIN